MSLVWAATRANHRKASPLKLLSLTGIVGRFKSSDIFDLLFLDGLSNTFLISHYMRE